MGSFWESQSRRGAHVAESGLFELIPRAVKIDLIAVAHYKCHPVLLAKTKNIFKMTGWGLTKGTHA